MTTRTLTLVATTLSNGLTQYQLTESAAPGKQVASNSLQGICHMVKDVLQRSSIAEVADAAHSGL